MSTRQLVYLLPLLFSIIKTIQSSEFDNSTLLIDADILDQGNETYSLTGEDKSTTLIDDLQALQNTALNTTFNTNETANKTVRRNPILEAIRSKQLETSTSSAINVLRSRDFFPTTTQPAPKTSLTRITSRFKINQLLEAIDDRLKNASMLLDSHVLVMQSGNGTVNVTRTWSFQQNRPKNITTGMVRMLMSIFTWLSSRLLLFLIGHLLRGFLSVVPSDHTGWHSPSSISILIISDVYPLICLYLVSDRRCSSRGVSA